MKRANILILGFGNNWSIDFLTSFLFKYGVNIQVYGSIRQWPPEQWIAIQTLMCSLVSF